MIHQGHCRPSELAAHSGDRGTVPVVNRRDPRAPRRAPIADVAVRAGGSLLTHGGGPGIPSAERRPSTHRGRLSALGCAVGCANIEERSGRPTSEKNLEGSAKKHLQKRGESAPTVDFASRRAQGLSRPAGTPPVRQSPAFPGRALTAPSTAAASVGRGKRPQYQRPEFHPPLR